MVIDTENFNADVIEKSYNTPVLVDFWAEWCGPCKILGPVLEKLAEKYSERFTLVKLNTDQYADIASHYGIKGIPNVKLFINGEVKAEFTGALPERQVEDWIKKNIPGKSESLLTEAGNLIASGDELRAEELLNQIKESDPDNTEADFLLAKLLLFKDHVKASSILSRLNDEYENILMLNALKTITELLKKNSSDSFPEGDVKGDYTEAVTHLKNKDFDNALKKFIEVIRTDRSYDDDGARKACISIFKYLGEEHPVTIKHRRDFGSALYV